MPQLYVAETLTGSALGLTWGLSDLAVAEIGGRVVLYGLSRTDGALVEMTIGPGGALTPAGKLSLSGGFAVGSDPGFVVRDGAAGASILLEGMNAASGALVTLDGNGSLGAQSVVPSVPTLIAPSTLDVPGGDVLITGRGGGGLETYVDTGAGWAFAAALPDSPNAYLASVSATATVRIGGNSFVLAASASEAGVTAVAVTDAGAMTMTSALGGAEGLPISVPSDLAVVQRLGETLIIVSASGTSSLSVMTMNAAGTISLADHVLDDLATKFQQVPVIDALVVGDFAFLAAGGTDGGVSLFTLLPGGRLVHLGSIADDATTTMYRVSGLAMAVSGGSLQIFASSEWEAGVTRIGYDLTALGAVLIGTGNDLFGTPLDDQLIGSDTAEDLTAGAGADIVYDGHGEDTMTGGAGADLFVFANDRVADHVLDFERGLDRLDLSAFDFLYDVSQLAVTATEDGAVLTFGEETIFLTSADGSPITIGDLSNATILNVNRPPLLTVHQTIAGGVDADTLTGGIGNDTIDGGGGDDALSGRDGDDWIIGGDGFDVIDGGAGDDRLEGGADADTISGGPGDDLIEGGDGGDLIYGDDIA